MIESDKVILKYFREEFYSQKKLEISLTLKDLVKGKVKFILLNSNYLSLSRGQSLYLYFKN